MKNKKEPLRKRDGLDNEIEPRKRGQAPGRTIEARENQIISLAYDLVEDRIKKKTATSQEVSHFLKMGSVSAQLEKTKLQKENELLEAKTEALKSQKRVEELYANAMKAFRSYSGQEENPDDDPD
jgi:hypothetical protein